MSNFFTINFRISCILLQNNLEFYSVMKKITILIFSIFLIFQGCKKSGDNKSTTRENILKDNAHIIDTSSIMNCSKNSLTLKNNNLSFTPLIGSIILASPCINNPTGVFAKISSIQKNGDNYICGIEPTSLNEAFDQLYIDFSYQADYVKNAQLKSGIVTKIPFPTNFQIAPGYYLNGSFNFNIPAVEIKYCKKKGSTLPDTVLIFSNVNTNGSTLSLEGSGSLTISEKRIYTYDKLPVILVPVPIGAVVWVIPFWQDIAINTLPLTVNGRLKFNFHPEFSASLGLSYINGSFDNLSGCNASITMDNPIKTDFDDNTTGSLTFLTPTYNIGPLYFLDLNDTTKPIDELSNLHGFFKIPNSLTGVIHTHQTPNYSINYQLDIAAGIHYNFWIGGNGEWSKSLTLYNTIIKQGNFDEGYSIGDTAFGGIIFYLDPASSYPNQHGMVCSLTDIQDSVFFQGGFFLSFPPFTGDLDSAMGSGMFNTLSLVNFFSNRANVATTCLNYTGGGYHDWYLPASDELKYFYSNKNNLLGFSGQYWSSMCSVEGPFVDSIYYIKVKYLNMSNGSINNEQMTAYGDGYFSPTGQPGILPDTNRYKVRAVRSF